MNSLCSLYVNLCMDIHKWLVTDLDLEAQKHMAIAQRQPNTYLSQRVNYLLGTHIKGWWLPEAYGSIVPSKISEYQALHMGHVDYWHVAYYDHVHHRFCEKVIEYFRCVALEALIHEYTTHVRIYISHRQYFTSKHKRFCMRHEPWMVHK